MHLAIGDLEAGMEVDREVSDSSDRILVGAGVILTGRHLEAFYAWGIASVSIRIEGEQEHALRELPEEEKRAIRARFAHIDITHPFAETLLEACFDLQRERPAPIPECE